MSDAFVLYDETEMTSTRYVGMAGDNARYDIAITSTAHFFGKKLVTVIQTGRTAILSQGDAADATYLKDAFNLASEEEAVEVADFLAVNL